MPTRSWLFRNGAGEDGRYFSWRLPRRGPLGLLKPLGGSREPLVVYVVGWDGAGAKVARSQRHDEKRLPSRPMG
jgi:hypothetical protein